MAANNLNNSRFRLAETSGLAVVSEGGVVVVVGISSTGSPDAESGVGLPKNEDMSVSLVLEVYSLRTCQ